MSETTWAVIAVTLLVLGVIVALMSARKHHKRDRAAKLEYPKNRDTR